MDSLALADSIREEASAASVEMDKAGVETDKVMAAMPLADRVATVAVGMVAIQVERVGMVMETAVIARR